MGKTPAGKRYWYVEAVGNTRYCVYAITITLYLVLSVDFFQLQ